MSVKQENKENEKSKKLKKQGTFNTIYLKKYGILTGILVFVFIILVGVTFASRDAWKNGLAVQVDQVLNESATVYEIGENIPVKNGFASSSAIYSVQSTMSKVKYYAVILRVQTFYGPMPGVFLFEEGKDYSTFMGFATVKGNIRNQINNVAKNSQIAYWESKVPEIVMSSLEMDGE